MFQCFNVSLKQMDGLGFLRGFYAIYAICCDFIYQILTYAPEAYIALQESNKTSV